MKYKNYWKPNYKRKNQTHRRPKYFVKKNCPKGKPPNQCTCWKCGLERHMANKCKTPKSEYFKKKQEIEEEINQINMREEFVHLEHEICDAKVYHILSDSYTEETSTSEEETSK